MCQILRPFISCFISGFRCECPHKCKRPQFQAQAVAQPLTTMRTTCKPPCSAPWGCRTALTSGTGHLSPSGDQDTYSRTQAEQLIPPTLLQLIMGAQLHKPFPTTQTCPTLFVMLSAWNISPSCVDQGPDPSAQTRQTPHKLKLYKLWCADLRTHLREGLGRAPTVIFSLTSRATQSFWVQYSWITPKNALKLLRSYAMSPVVSEE